MNVIKNKRLLPVVLFFALLSLGMGRAPRKEILVETQRMALQSLVEDALGDIEFAYESKNSEELMGFLDKNFEGRERFQAVLESFFHSVERPHLHFVIDMILADKNGVNVRLHWFKRGVTGSNVFIRAQGSSQFLFKRYPDGLRLKRIDKENPFF